MLPIDVSRDNISKQVIFYGRLEVKITFELPADLGGISRARIDNDVMVYSARF